MKAVDDVPLSNLHHRGHVPTANDETDVNEDKVRKADNSNYFHPVDDSTEDEDASGSMSPSYFQRRSQE